MKNTPHDTVAMKVPLADVSETTYSDEQLRKMHACVVDELHSLTAHHRRVADELYRRSEAARKKRRTGETPVTGESPAANGSHEPKPLSQRGR